MPYPDAKNDGHLDHRVAVLFERALRNVSDRIAYVVDFNDTTYEMTVPTSCIQILLSNLKEINFDHLILSLSTRNVPPCMFSLPSRTV